MLTCLCVPSLYGCSLMRGRCTKNGLRLEGTTGRCGGASGTAPWHARKDTGHAFLRFACLPAPAPPCFFHCYQSDSVRVVTVLGDRQIRQHENDSSGSVSATNRVFGWGLGRVGMERTRSHSCLDGDEESGLAPEENIPLRYCNIPKIT